MSTRARLVELNRGNAVSLGIYCNHSTKKTKKTLHVRDPKIKKSRWYREGKMLHERRKRLNKFAKLPDEEVETCSKNAEMSNTECRIYDARQLAEEKEIFMVNKTKEAKGFAACLRESGTCGLASMITAQISDVDNLIRDCMAAYRGAGVYGVNVVDTAADGVNFDYPDTHYGKVDLQPGFLACWWREYRITTCVYLYPYLRCRRYGKDCEVLTRVVKRRCFQSRLYELIRMIVAELRLSSWSL